VNFGHILKFQILGCDSTWRQGSAGVVQRREDTQCGAESHGHGATRQVQTLSRLGGRFGDYVDTMPRVFFILTQ
jgi:hypothetical protein